MYTRTQTGLPICRPLFLNDGQDMAVYEHLDDPFFVGGGLRGGHQVRPLSPHTALPAAAAVACRRRTSA